VSKRAGFHRRIEDARRIHLDPFVIAYHLIGQSPFVDLTRLLFTSIRGGRVRAQTSALSIYQLLTEPYREGEDGLAERAFKYLGSHPGLEILPVTAVGRCQGLCGSQDGTSPDCGDGDYQPG
jgi:hypothetical protein